jgi:hypothetical protein
MSLPSDDEPMNTWGLDASLTAGTLCGGVRAAGGMGVPGLS